MDKLTLRRIAKDWCQGILLACDTDANEGLLTEEEMGYVVEEAHRIAMRISKNPPLASLNQIIKRYYEFETTPNSRD